MPLPRIFQATSSLATRSRSFSAPQLICLNHPRYLFFSQMSFINFLVSSFRQLATSMSTPMEDTWNPSVRDVLEVKDILFKASKMPTELIDAIIDHAEYWPHTSVNTSTYSPQQLEKLQARGGINSKEDIFIIRSVPIGILPEQIDSDTHLGITDGFSVNPPKPVQLPEPSEAAKSATDDLLKGWTSTNPIRGKPCRKIVFTIHSHDQGWGGRYQDRGTFNGAFTWFDVGLERLEACEPSSSQSSDIQRFPVTTPTSNMSNTSGPQETETFCTLRTISPPISEEGKFNHPFLPQPNHLVRNRTATKTLQKHVITWSRSDDISPDSPAADSDLENEGRGKASGNGEFVRNLKVGDVVTIWSRARFPMWANTLEYCQIDVYWAV